MCSHADFYLKEKKLTEVSLRPTPSYNSDVTVVTQLDVNLKPSNRDNEGIRFPQIFRTTYSPLILFPFKQN